MSPTRLAYWTLEAGKFLSTVSCDEWSRVIHILFTQTSLIIFELETEVNKEKSKVRGIDLATVDNN